MKKDTRLKIKKVTLNILSVSLLIILVVPTCVLVTEALGILFAQTTFSLAIVWTYAASYGVSIFSMYKLSRNVFNFLKDRVIVGHKSLKRKMKNICNSVKKLEETKDIYNKAKTLSCVEDLIKREGDILEKADETIELLFYLSRSNALKLLFSDERKDEFVVYIARLQKLKQKYKASIDKLELIKAGKQIEVSESLREENEIKNGLGDLISELRDIKNELKKREENGEKDSTVLKEKIPIISELRDIKNELKKREKNGEKNSTVLKE